MTPNPGDYKPCSAEEIKAYKRMILAKNIKHLKKITCPDCGDKGSIYFTGELFDLDSAFVECSSCDYQGWILLRGTGLPSETCRFLGDNGSCNKLGTCKFITGNLDLRKCRLFKEAISASHRARMLMASERVV